jgi:hypothetical protein
LYKVERLFPDWIVDLVLAGGTKPQLPAGN